MNDRKRPGRVNVKLLVILVLVLGILGGGFVVGYKIRKRMIADEALAAGLAAYESGNWTEAAEQLHEYLSRYPDDEEVLLKYARAHLSVRPLEAENLRYAITAYRRYLRFRPGDEEASNALAELYHITGQPTECKYIAERRLAVRPEDTKARLWLGRALLAQGRFGDAREELKKIVDDKGNRDCLDAFSLLSELERMDQTNPSDQRSLEWLTQAVQYHQPMEVPQVRADALARRGRFYQEVLARNEEAEADFREAESLNPADPRVRLMLAEGWLALADKAADDSDYLDRAERQIEALKEVDTAELAEFSLEVANLQIIQYKSAAILAMRRENREEAVRLAEEALATLKGNARVLFMPFAIELYLLAGRVDDADRLLREYDTEVSKQPRIDQATSGRLAMFKARQSLLRGEPYEAIARLEEAVAGTPLFPEIWRLLSVAYRVSGQQRRSLTALEEFVRRVPADRPARQQLLRDYRANQQYDKLLELSDRMLADDRSDVEARLMKVQAEIAGAGGKLDDARLGQLEETLAVLRETAPAEADTWILSALLAHRSEKRAEAEEFLVEGIERVEEPLPIYMQLVKLYLGSERAERAIATCQSAIERFPGKASPRLALARILLADGRTEEARDVLDEAAKALEGDERRQVQLEQVNALMNRGLTQEGLGRLRELAEKEPDNVQIRLALLQEPEVQANPDEVGQLIEGLRRIEGDRGIRWRYQQAQAWLRQDDWQSRQATIAEMLDQCIQRDPRWQLPVVTLGAMYERLGRDDRAEQVYRGFLETQTRNPLVLSRLLALLERQGRFTESSRILEGLPTEIPGLGSFEVRAAISRGEYSDAIERLERDLEANPQDASAHVLLARLLYLDGRHTEAALDHLRKAAEIDPDQIMHLSTRVAILHSEGRDDEALEVINREVERGPGFLPYLLRAEFLNMLGQIERAEQDYRHLLTFKDRHAQACSRLARFYEGHRQFDKAVEICEKGLAEAPDDVTLRTQLARLYVGAQDTAPRDRGLRILNELIAQSPNDTKLLSIKAGALLARQTLEASREAESLLERVVQLNRGDVTAHVYLIELARGRNELNRASELASRALGANPRNPGLMLLQAEIENERGNGVAAREIARSALEIDPTNLVARNLLASISLEQGNIAEARRINDEAMLMAPDNESILITGTNILRAERKLEEAIKLLEGFRQKEGSVYTAATDLALADMYRLKGDYDAATTYLESAARTAPDNPQTLIARWRLMAAQGKFDDLIASADDFCRRHPDLPRPLLTAALIVQAGGEREHLAKIEPLFERFTKDNPRNVKGKFGYAMLLHALGRPNAACEVYREVLELEPTHQHALNNLAWILGEELGKHEEAIRHAEKGVDTYPNDPHMLNTRGVLYYRLGDLRRARSDLDKCLSLSLNKPSTRAKTLVFLGRIREKQGELDDARQDWRQALEIDDVHHVLSTDERAEIEKALRPG